MIVPLNRYTSSWVFEALLPVYWLMGRFSLIKRVNKDIGTVMLLTNLGVKVFFCNKNPNVCIERRFKKPYNNKLEAGSIKTW